MKKFFFFLILSICFSTSYGFSFKDNFKKENNNIGFGFHFGAIGQRQDMGLQIFMGSVTYKGFYLDFGGWLPVHGRDTHVGTWDDDRAFLIHVGYNIPIAPCVRLTPLIGYASNESGYTDGYDWHVTSSGISNHFVSGWACKGLDYGAQLTININHFNITGTYTRFAWYAGIGYEIHF